MLNITPAKNWVILKTEEVKTSSGIIAPEPTKDAPQIGTVYKIGKGTPPLPLKEGDVVVFKKYMGNKMHIPQLSDTFDFLPFEDLVAVISEGK